MWGLLYLSPFVVIPIFLREYVLAKWNILKVVFMFFINSFVLFITKFIPKSLFENYLYDEPEETPDRDSLEENLHQAGFTNVEIEKAFSWLDDLAEQRHQPDLFLDNHRPIRVYVDSEIARLDTECRDFLM